MTLKTEAPRWYTSSPSDNGGACVEVATNLAATHNTVPVRDSKNTNGPTLTIPTTQWTAFLTTLKADQPTLKLGDRATGRERQRGADTCGNTVVPTHGLAIGSGGMTQLSRKAVRPVRAVRAVRADEWRRAKELRLLALRDRAAPIAFLDAYEHAAAEPDFFWRERTLRASSGTRARQFVAEDSDGDRTWIGTVTVLVEDVGGGDAFSETASRRQAHLVSVFVRAEHRGTGVIDALFDAAAEWAWSVAEVSRARLFVHEDNGRAERFYQRFGFVRSGATIPMKGDPSKVEHEMVLEQLGLRTDCEQP